MWIVNFDLQIMSLFICGVELLFILVHTVHCDVIVYIYKISNIYHGSV